MWLFADEVMGKRWSSIGEYLVYKNERIKWCLQNYIARLWAKTSKMLKD